MFPHSISRSTVPPGRSPDTDPSDPTASQRRPPHRLRAAASASTALPGAVLDALDDGDRGARELVVDLFAGPGGLDEGLRLAGYGGALLGLEVDHDACATAVAAGHARVCVDVCVTPPRRTGVG